MGIMFMVNISTHFFGLMYSGIELLDHRVYVRLALVNIATQFSKVVMPFHTRIHSVWEYQLLHPSHVDGDVLVSHCSCTLSFLNDYGCWAPSQQYLLAT